MAFHVDNKFPATAHEVLQKRLVFTDFIPDGARTLQYAPPQPIYTSTIDALLEKKLLANAHLTAWQYVLIAQEELVGVAEVRVTKPGADAEAMFQILYPAEYAQSVNLAIDAADKQPGNYELRMLRVSQVYLFAVWLVHGCESLLLPVEPVPSRLRGREVWTEPDLSLALNELARNRRYTRDR
jgi:hypothetical protein